MSKFGIMVLVLLCAVVRATAAPGEKPLSPEACAEGEQFTTQLQNIVALISREYVKPIPDKEFYRVAIVALYSSARHPLPPRLLDDLQATKDAVTLRALLINARAKLYGAPQLADQRDLLVAVGAFTSILDPASLLQPSATLNGTPTSANYGFELEGEANVSAKRRPDRRVPGDGDPRPMPEEVPTLPFRVLFVKPGSPAQKAGLRPEDQVTHVDDIRADAHEATKAYAALRNPGPDPQRPNRHTLTVERVGQTKPLRLAVVQEEYLPESLFGVKRKANNEWDYWIDREARLAYVRLGSIEHDSGELLSEILHDLRDIKGLLFDLRWCPGGYIDSATSLASIFLDSGVIAKMTYRNPSRGNAKEIHADGGLVRYKAGKYPILVLVNGETIGGGELIAAALKDNDRAILAGTRTFGKATIQWPEPIRELPGYSFKVTGGTYTRPNGKNLQRFPTSKATDDWGLRPDAGYVIPTSDDLAKKLREMHTLYALRPGQSREALELDDPETDPQRVRAVKLLRELSIKQPK